MMTYDRNRNAITTGSRVMISGTGQFGVIKAIHSDGLNAEQVRRGKTVEVEGCEGKFEPIELIRPDMPPRTAACHRVKAGRRTQQPWPSRLFAATFDRPA